MPYFAAFSGSYQSGQMGQTVNLLATPTVVRIHHSPQKKRTKLVRFFYYSTFSTSLIACLKFSFDKAPCAIWGCPLTGMNNKEGML
jgi:hypothetical protein